MREGLSKLARLIFVGLLFLPIQLARANPGAIYVATNNGVFKSTDRGANWTVANSGLAGIDVFSLAIDPSNPATLYAGTLGRRVFESANGGQSWTAASSGLTDTIVLSLAIDPANPNTIYAGTATSAFFPGSGVFKSVNAGESWTVSNSGLPNAVIEVLEIDPTDPAVIYAGTNFDGVYKSTDGGQNWTAANSGMNPALVADLAVDPANPATVYAGLMGCSFNCLNPAGVLKSTDGGGGWTAVNSGLTDLQVVSLAVDPDNTNILYSGTQLHGVFRSINGGSTWRQVNPSLSPTSFGISHFPLVIDSLIPGTVYAGTADGVFKSTDSGMSWTSTNAGFPASTSVFSLAIEPAQEPPLIGGGSDAPAIFHAASFELLQFPETRLPLGGIVTIFGTNLGPANGISASSLPLGTELGGTSIEITAGGKTVKAWMLFSSANQINAIIPSRVAEGLADIRVVRGGIPSPDVGIRLGRSAFGMFTLNQQGSGPAVVQNINSATDQPVNDLFHPAAPGQVLTVWGSGLGPVAGDDSQPGPVEDLDADVHVFVGDTESQVLYKGRSPQFPGLDQINLRLSENVPLGCRVPITVVVDGRTSRDITKSCG